jgi:hypothetical protein
VRGRPAGITRRMAREVSSGRQHAALCVLEEERSLPDAGLPVPGTDISRLVCSLGLAVERSSQSGAEARVNLSQKLHGCRMVRVGRALPEGEAADGVGRRDRCVDRIRRDGVGIRGELCGFEECDGIGEPRLRVRGTAGGATPRWAGHGHAPGSEPDNSGYPLPTPASPRHRREQGFYPTRGVGLDRIELSTSALSVLRSNRLSYSPRLSSPGAHRRWSDEW